MIRLSELINPSHFNNRLLTEAGIKDFRRYITKSPQERAQEMLKKTRANVRDYVLFIDDALRKIPEGYGTAYDKLYAEFKKWWDIHYNEQGATKFRFYSEQKLFRKYPELEKQVDQNIINWFSQMTDDYLDKNYKQMSGLQNRGRTYDRFNDVSWAYFRFIKDLPPDTWLIHFSKWAEDIHNKGQFTNLVKDARYLGFTAPGARTARYFEPERGTDGYGFAYTAEFIKKENRVNFGMVDNSRRDALMFQARGVLAYHRIDETEEVIFWGPDAKNMVFIFHGDSGDYHVLNSGAESMFRSKDIKGAVEWVEKNFERNKSALKWKT